MACDRSYEIGSMNSCRSCGKPLIRFMVGLGASNEIICPACYEMLLQAQVFAAYPNVLIFRGRA
jgi:hypothetical protein